MALSKKSRTVPKRFLGAFKKGHRVSARDMIDEDLSWELLDRIESSKWTDTEAIEALDYITRFNNEYHKNVIKKDDPNALHNTDELRRSCYARENAKNRDLMSVGNQDTEITAVKHSQFNDDVYESKTQFDVGKGGILVGSEPYSGVNYTEDALIDLIDASDLLKLPIKSEQ